MLLEGLILADFEDVLCFWGGGRGRGDWVGLDDEDDDAEDDSEED